PKDAALITMLVDTDELILLVHQRLVSRAGLS
ncbi:MAG: hypothetical protein ACI9WC_003312, partial [Arenicella sp.]